MSVVVTGANGHLGGNLARELLRHGDVRATVHRNSDVLATLGVEQVPADILDIDSLRSAFRGAETVYHLAAKISIQGDKDGSVWRINVDGAGNVARAAREAGARMVHVSSVHAFDMGSPPVPIDEAHPRPGPKAYAYDRSKAAGEERVRAEIAQGLDATIVNPTGIIGPGDHVPSRMGQVFLDLRDRKLPALVAGAFDFVDVRDVVASIVAASTKGDPGENHLLGGHHVTVRELAELAAQTMEVPAPRMTIPLWLATAAVPFAGVFQRGQPTFTFESLGALRHGVPVDHTKASEVLGHAPRPLQETVRDIYAWFDAEGM